MLAEMEPAEMDERIAAETLDGGDPYAVITAVLIRGFTALCRSWGAEVTPEDFDPRPRVGEVKSQQEKPAGQIVASPDQTVAFLAATLGQGGT